jgi:hypothetical protein
MTPKGGRAAYHRLRGLLACEQAARADDEEMEPSVHDNLNICNFYARSSRGKGFNMSPEPFLATQVCRSA